MRAHLWLILPLLAASGAGAAEIDDVLLNEATVRGPERVELYNRGAATIDLGGWTIGGTLGTHVIPANTFLAPGQYMTIGVVGPIFHEIGGEICLLDDLNTLGDRVWYGNQGSAPLAHDNPLVSMSRAPDASFSPPLNPGPATSGLYWTLDFSSTFGAMNDAPPAASGSSLFLNEVSPRLVPLAGGANDVVELYNPTGGAINVGGWIVSVGTGVEDLIAGIVPAGGVLAIPLGPATFADDAELVYLFDAAGTRLDQVGWTGGPDVEEGLCYARCGDGEGPFLGYDWVTTGGGSTWFLQACTLGLLNGDTCSPVPVAPATWGRVKGHFRP